MNNELFGQSQVNRFVYRTLKIRLSHIMSFIQENDLFIADFGNTTSVHALFILHCFLCQS